MNPVKSAEAETAFYSWRDLPPKRRQHEDGKNDMIRFVDTRASNGKLHGTRPVMGERKKKKRNLPFNILHNNKNESQGRRIE